jgi:DNA-binding IclR family transcriptional regulator
VGVIDIITPEDRNTSEHHALCKQMLLDGTAQLSAQIGYHGD